MDPPGGMSVQEAFRKLYHTISPRRRRLFLPMLGLMLAGALAEVMTLGALLPFLAVIADPGGAFLSRLKPVLDSIGLGSFPVIYVLTAAFALSAIVSATLRLALLWANNAFVNGISYELSTKLYDTALHDPYILHTRRNTSETIATINKVELLSWSVLGPVANGIVSLVIAVFMVAGLIYINPAVALSSGLGLAAIYFAATMTCRRQMQVNSRVISAAQGRAVKSMQEGLGGIRDVLIDHSQPVFLAAYESALAGLRDARTRNTFFAGAPRFFVEALGMVLIAGVAVVVTGQPGSLTTAIPVLGTLALGAQRLLPLLQQIYHAWAQVIGNRQVIIDVAEQVRQSVPKDEGAVTALPFETAIRLDGLSFTYPGASLPALTGIDDVIPKGARVGVIGRTGSGKSTLMDLLLGLLEPSEGRILVDGVTLDDANRRAWQKNIAHVPQAIFLADASIAENIAFGVERHNIDRDRVASAARQAELTDVIANLPQGFDTRVGERGIQLSGGQRQRIGIARALYKQASVLIFDEATSALDSETESAVMAAIKTLDRRLTILIIAHRLSTLEDCNMIIQLEAGRLLDRRHLPRELQQAP